MIYYAPFVELSDKKYKCIIRQKSVDDNNDKFQLVAYNNNYYYANTKLSRTHIEYPTLILDVDDNTNLVLSQKWMTKQEKAKYTLLL